MIPPTLLSGDAQNQGADATADLQAVSAGSVAAGGSGTGIWMVTFADLILLLLAFFVMLFAMSSPDVEALKKAAALLSTRGTIPIAPETAPAPATANSQAVIPPRAAPAEYLSAVLRDGLDRIRPLRDTAVSLTGDTVVLRPPPGVLTDDNNPGGDGTGTSTDSGAGLADLAGLLDRLDNRILVVVGHSPQGRTEDPWVTALTDATRVANRLREAGFSRPLTAQARLADTPADEAVTLEVLGEGGGRGGRP